MKALHLFIQHSEKEMHDIVIRWPFLIYLLTPTLLCSSVNPALNGGKIPQMCENYFVFSTPLRWFKMAEQQLKVGRFHLPQTSMSAHSVTDQYQHARAILLMLCWQRP
jgi:hypothetical protein